MNFLKIKENALKYLGDYQSIDNHLSLLIDECIKEIDDLQSFKAIYQIYSLDTNPLTIKELDLILDYQELNELFNNCQKIVIIACTLGVQVEQRIHYYYHIDMTKAVILDAVASSYLEYKCDEYEDIHLNNKRTYRYCPGYGSVPLSLNNTLAKILKVNKIGLSIQDNYLFLPQKSMLGLIGLGDKNKNKSCFNCIVKDCSFRKRGLTCYVKD